jgi:hypothetical protein
VRRRVGVHESVTAATVGWLCRRTLKRMEQSHTRLGRRGGEQVVVVDAKTWSRGCRQGLWGRSARSGTENTGLRGTPLLERPCLDDPRPGVVRLTPLLRRTSGRLGSARLTRGVRSARTAAPVVRLPLLAAIAATRSSGWIRLGGGARLGTGRAGGEQRSGGLHLASVCHQLGWRT